MMMLLPLLLGCAQPLHMQYDFGRSYMEAGQLQANLDRPSVAKSVYELSGTESLNLRANVEKATSEEKSGEIEKVDK